MAYTEQVHGQCSHQDNDASDNITEEVYMQQRLLEQCIKRTQMFGLENVDSNEDHIDTDNIGFVSLSMFALTSSPARSLTRRILASALSSTNNSNSFSGLVSSS